MSKTKRAVEMEDLLVRLRAIEREMPQQEAQVKKAPASGDRFLAAKSEFLEGMSSVKDSIQELRSNSGAGRTRDYIARTSQIRKKLDELSKLFLEMESIHSKDMRRRRQKLSAEELDMRGHFLTQFRSDLQSLKSLTTKSFITDPTAAGAANQKDLDSAFGGGNTDSHLGLDTNSFFSSLPKREDQTAGSYFGGSAGGDGHGVELTDMQKQSLEQIKRRDQEFDLLLDQIGIGIDAAKEKAKAINDLSQLQSTMMDKIDEEIVKTMDQMNVMNVTLKKSLEESGGAERFCINCMCFVFLLGIVGVIVNVIS